MADRRTREVCEFKYDKSLSADNRDGGKFPVYGSNGVVGGHSSALTGGPTIVVGRKGSFGQVAYSQSACWPIDTTYYVDASTTSADIKWLSYRLRGLGLTSLNRAAAIPGLNREDAYRQRLLLPPLAEQRRIAAILDHADALRAKRHQVLVHLDALPQSMFRNMFGKVSDSLRLASVVGEFRYGTSSKAGEAGYPTLRIPNVIGGSLALNEIKTVEVARREFDRLRLQSGDLLFVRTNGNPDNVGRCAVFDTAAASSLGWPTDRWIYASYLIRARLTEEQHPTYVATYLASPAGRRQLWDRSRTSAGQYNINIDGISSIEVPRAPAGLQQEFASRVEQVKTQRAALQRNRVADDELFASLQSRAFRGDL